MRPFFRSLQTALLAALPITAPAAAQQQGQADYLQVVSGTVVSEVGRSLARVGDANDDGIREFVAANQLGEVFGFDGRTGNQLWRVTTLTPTPSLFEADDFDGDGRQDWGVVDRFGQQPFLSLHLGYYGWAYLMIPLPVAHTVVHVERADDRNGDGVDELLVVLTEWSTQQTYVRWISPVDGSTVLTFQYTIPQNGSSQSAAMLADVDGDGVRDFLLGDLNADFGGVQQAGSATARSGADGSFLSAVYGSAYLDRIGSSVAAAGDLDGDGVGDALAHSWQRDYIIAFSPKRGVELYRVPSTGAYFRAWPANRCGDRDGDGLEDWFEGPVLRSGFDGRPLHDVSDPAVGFAICNGEEVVPTHDFDGDGQPEMMITGAPGAFAASQVYVVSYRAGLSADARVLHALAPTPLTFTMEFPPEVGGHRYRLLASAAPIGSTQLFGLEVPLASDPLLNLMLSGPSAWLPEGTGVVDASTLRAEARMDLVPGLLARAVGMTVRFAVVTAAGGAATWTSVSIPVTILP